MATKTETKEKYIGAVGRRKTAIASIRLYEGGEGVTVNGKPYTEYFPTEEMKGIVLEPFASAKLPIKLGITAVLKGGGIHSQAEALRHGIARAIIAFDAELRKKLKKDGLLKRDPRAKERRKFGLKKARKAAQWSKR
jgi:small subunit ribosomal protein S9